MSQAKGSKPGTGTDRHRRAGESREARLGALVPDRWRRSAGRLWRVATRFFGDSVERGTVARLDAKRARAEYRAGTVEFATVQGKLVVARIVTEFDAQRVLAEGAAEVARALVDGGLERICLPSGGVEPRRIAVPEADAGQLAAALAPLLADRPMYGVGLCGRRRVHGSLRLLREPSDLQHLIDRYSVIRLFSYLTASHGSVLAGEELACDLEIWFEITQEGVERADGGTHIPGTIVACRPNRWAAYLSPAAREEARRSGSGWSLASTAAGGAHLFDVAFPIDVVYTWVDGSDPAWQGRRRSAEAASHLDDVNETATSESRFLSRDELKYSLRSLSMYASWIRDIYLVTDDQAPEWLDVSHPKIHVVDHREIFEDQSGLPTFNSHAIESQLHRIPGLAEHYVYLNDDVFIGRPLPPEAFFHANGVSKFFVSTAVLDLDPPSSRDLPVLSAAKNNRAIVEQRFGGTITHKFQHTPHPQVKAVMEDIERECPETFATTAASRFRNPADISIASALHHYWAFATGRAVPDRVRYAYQDISDPSTPRRLASILATKSYDVFCLNDTATPPEVRGEAVDFLTEFLDAYFPIPSPFER